jgi:5'-deoxynucleotidase YfbR-like HD superfamily hydrolase
MGMLEKTQNANQRQEDSPSEQKHTVASHTFLVTQGAQALDAASSEDSSPSGDCWR